MPVLNKNSSHIKNASVEQNQQLTNLAALRPAVCLPVGVRLAHVLQKLAHDSGRTRHPPTESHWQSLRLTGAPKVRKPDSTGQYFKRDAKTEKKPIKPYKTPIKRILKPWI